MKRLNLPQKFSGSISKGPAAVPKPAMELTGLEGVLQLDQQFVEATKATEDDEARRNVQKSNESSHEDLIVEKRYLVGDSSNIVLIILADSHQASRIPASAEGMPGDGKGFQNFTGALCYRHSLFQALLHTPKFVHWLRDYHKPEDCKLVY